MNLFRPVPEIDVNELAERLESADPFVVLDVREVWETRLASLNDPRLSVVPLSRLSNERNNALPSEAQDRSAEIYVLCHHGVRSADVTRWMQSQGWERVYSVRGGIEAYALQIDPSIGKY